MALGSVSQEAIWLQQLLKDLRTNPEVPTDIFEDNQSAIALVKNLVSHKRTKHIDIKHHYYFSLEKQYKQEQSMYLIVHRKISWLISSLSHCLDHKLRN